MVPKPVEWAPKSAKPDPTTDLAQQASSIAMASGEATGASLITNTDQILIAIQAMKEDIMSRFDGPLNAIQGVKSELKAVIVRVTEAEDRISSNDDDTTSLQTQNAAMKATMEKLVLKTDDLENRSRCPNLRWVGLPENKEGADTCAFLEKLLADVLSVDNFPGPLLMESTQNRPAQAKESLRPGEERSGFPLHSRATLRDYPPG